MARIVYSHPRQTRGDFDYHVYTDLDFWDARKILKGVPECVVKRNYGQQPPGDGFPTQVTARGAGPARIRTIEHRLRKAVPSPPRHLIAKALAFEGEFVFDPLDYYPERWSPGLMARFTHYRLGLHLGVLSTPHRAVEIDWEGRSLRLRRVLREKKHDPVIRNSRDARRHAIVPSCF